MDIHKFRQKDWVKIWEGKWSFLTCSHFGDQYTKEIRFGPRPFVSQSIIFSAHGRSSAWIRQHDRDVLGNYLSKQLVKNPKLAKTVPTLLEKQVKNFLKFIDHHENTECTWQLYEEFWERLRIYYQPHIHIKYIVDYLDPKLLAKYLPKFQEARLAAEPVLNRTEDFMFAFAKLLSKKTTYNYKLLLCLTKRELKNYFIHGKLPSKAILQTRDSRASLLHYLGTSELYVGANVKKIETLVNQKKYTSIVKGNVAFPGKTTGTARVVGDPGKVKIFNVGDILITGMTRPDFLPLMHKAAAFVTDAGGILSHAAIVARELKKPCIIGTLVSSKVFKDGDTVEVDATNGIVKKI